MRPKNIAGAAEDTWHAPFGARPGIEREDDEIWSDILVSLENDPDLSFPDLVVRVDAGVVTLSGEVQSISGKDSATRDAWNVPGVVAVHNFLEIEET